MYALSAHPVGINVLSEQIEMESIASAVSTVQVEQRNQTKIEQAPIASQNCKFVTKKTNFS